MAREQDVFPQIGKHDHMIHSTHKTFWVRASCENVKQNVSSIDAF